MSSPMYVSDRTQTLRFLELQIDVHIKCSLFHFSASFETSQNTQAFRLVDCRNFTVTPLAEIELSPMIFWPPVTSLPSSRLLNVFSTDRDETQRFTLVWLHSAKLKTAFWKWFGWRRLVEVVLEIQKRRGDGLKQKSIKLGWWHSRTLFCLQSVVASFAQVNATFPPSLPQNMKSFELIKSR